MLQEIRLSVVIPSHTARVAEGLFTKVIQQLEEQTKDNPFVEVLSIVDNGRMSIGAKMDMLYYMARGEFIAAVADDDQVTDDYIHELMAAIDTYRSYDVISFDHNYYYDGEFRAVIKESIYLPYATNNETQLYTRSPSPKCAIKADHCKEYKHPNIWHGEDREFTRWVLPKLKKEHKIDKVLYHYFYRGKNKHWRRKMAHMAGVR